MGIPNQAKIDLFRKYSELLGVFDVERNVKNAKGEEHSVKLRDSIAWFDASMSKEDGKIFADNKEGKYYNFIGTYEQMGRGVDIQLQKYQNVKKVDLVMVDPHLSYKSAVEQLAGRVLGTRFADQAVETIGKFGSKDIIKNINISIVSDKQTIDAYAAEHEGKMRGNTGEDYVNLINDRVYGEKRTGEEAEDKVVRQSGATVANIKAQARPYIQNDKNMKAAFEKMGLSEIDRSIVFSMLHSRAYHNGYELTGKGSVAMGYVMQLLGYNENGERIISEEEANANISNVQQILNKGVSDINRTYSAREAVNLIYELQTKGILATGVSSGASLADILNIKTLLDSRKEEVNTEKFKSFTDQYSTSGLNEKLVGAELFSAANKVSDSIRNKENLTVRYLKLQEDGYYSNGITGKIKQLVEGIKIKFLAQRKINREESKLNNLKREEADNAENIKAAALLASLQVDASGNLVFGSQQIISNFEQVFNAKSFAENNGFKLSRSYDFAKLDNAVRKGEYIDAQDIMLERGYGRAARTALKIGAGVGIGLLAAISPWVSLPVGLIIGLVHTALMFMPKSFGNAASDKFSKLNIFTKLGEKIDGINMPILKSDRKYYNFIKQLKDLVKEKEEAAAPLREELRKKIAEAKAKGLSEEKIYENEDIKKMFKELNQAQAITMSDIEKVYKTEEKVSKELLAFMLINPEIKDEETLKKVKEYTAINRKADISKIKAGEIDKLIKSANQTVKENQNQIVDAYGRTPEAEEFVKGIKGKIEDEIETMKDYDKEDALGEAALREGFGNMEYLLKQLESGRTMEEIKEDLKENKKKGIVEKAKEKIGVSKVAEIDKKIDKDNTVKDKNKEKEKEYIKEALNILEKELEAVNAKDDVESVNKGIEKAALFDEEYVNVLMAIAAEAKEKLKLEPSKLIADKDFLGQINDIYDRNGLTMSKKKDELYEYIQKNIFIRVEKVDKKQDVAVAEKKLSIAQRILDGDYRLAGRVAAAVNRKINPEGSGRKVTHKDVSELLQNCAVAALDELEKLPKIKDLADAIAKVFAVNEGDKGAVGHLKVVKGSALNNEIKFTNVKEDTFEYRLAAGEEAENAMKLSDFIDQSGYVPVTVKDTKALKAELKDEQVALYTDKTGNTILLVSKEKAIDLMKKGLVEPAMSVVSKKKLQEIFVNKNTDLKLTKAVEQLGRAIVDGVTAPAELNRQLAYVLSVWPDAASMMERIGITGKEVLSKEGMKAIINGYYAAANEVVKAGAKGTLSAEEVNIEIKLLSTVRDLLITLNQAGNREELLAILNKESITLEDFSKLSDNLKVSKAVNHNVIVETMASIKTGYVNAGNDEFVINLDDLKKAIESKKGTAERVAKFFRGNKNVEDILPTLAGRELKEKTRGLNITPMMAKAVAASA
jgi:hypothetical protein